MKQPELAAALDAAGVPASAYGLPGPPERGTARQDGAVHLAKEPDGSWSVVAVSRGDALPEGRYATEDEACRAMYDLLTYEPPTVTLSAQEQARTAAITEAETARIRALINDPTAPGA